MNNNEYFKLLSKLKKIESKIDLLLGDDTSKTSKKDKKISYIKERSEPQQYLDNFYPDADDVVNSKLNYR